jgi:branched-chain amino acid transport system permease protein
MHFSSFIDQFWTYTVTGLTAGSIYALVALGYTLVYGVLRLINFAHSEIFMIGSFGAVFATRWLGVDATGDPKSGLALIGALLFSAVIAMAFGGGAAVALERIAYRPLRGSGDLYGAIALAFITSWVVAYVLPPDNSAADLITALVLTAPVTLWYRRLLGRGRQATRLAFLISAIGASLAISEGFAWWRGRNFEQYPRMLKRTRLFSFFDADIRIDQVVVIVGALAMMLALDVFVNRTRLGRGIRSVAQDQETARLMGVNVDNVIMITFLLGGIMAGGAGFLFVLFYENTKYNIGFLLGVKAFTAAVLGGIGNLRGALLGGLALGLVENYGAAITNSKWKDPIAFAVLLLVLMVRPTGLLGEKLSRARA